jgi:hypothetical protein
LRGRDNKASSSGMATSRKTAVAGEPDLQCSVKAAHSSSVFALPYLATIDIDLLSAVCSPLAESDWYPL